MPNSVNSVCVNYLMHHMCYMQNYFVNRLCITIIAVQKLLNLTTAIRHKCYLGKEELKYTSLTFMNNNNPINLYITATYICSEMQYL